LPDVISRVAQAARRVAPNLRTSRSSVLSMLLAVKITMIRSGIIF
jgi:hypothetical protein